MLNFTKKLIISLVISVFIFGCSNSEIQFESESKKTLYGFYEDLKKGAYENAIDRCHKYWFKYWSNEQTLEFLRKIDEVKGKVIEYQLSEVYPGADLEGEQPVGYYFTCIMQVKREFESSEEMIVIMREPGNTEFEVLTYSVK
ncbi:MAG: hypothetical protein A2W91_01810 [Bacteroidetes bacterium GWF2_38_335]|nr:MAG: hypothetical protein A2W91_01810 [Bacteroidetes bacterium GWF2_38_335]OFY78803.1 MAG: hypothetical protein A2281_19385 [Bacteroidetes bacterium RIFOXYA12_FULL_38_20]HBS85200.1 hypothetical protein [Bacteroidales bacterium]